MREDIQRVFVFIVKSLFYFALHSCISFAVTDNADDAMSMYISPPSDELRER